MTRKIAAIVVSTGKIKAYERLSALCGIAGEGQEWCDAPWTELLFDAELFDEMVFYLENHFLLDKVKCEGYGLTDLYVWQLDRYNLIGDTGKNTDACNKERMVLHAFYDMAAMKKDPRVYIKRMTLGRGMDEQA